MKKQLFTAIALILSLTTIHSQDFYDVSNVNSIEITFSESNWDQILDSYYAAGNEQRLVGSVVLNGVQYDSVGVRYKGNSTYSANRVKNPLNIKLDHIIDYQTIDGYGTLKLANVFKDPSFVREVLSYEIARKYMPASQANFINVTINGTLIGLYSSVQDVDKLFMGTNFFSNDNPTFKGEVAQSGPPTFLPIWTYLGTDSSQYASFFEIDSDYGWAELINFLDVLNNSPASVEDVLNVDRHLWMLAYDILMVNLDAPINFAHNYYLYQDDAGRFNPIIWDLNENFGGFTRLLAGGNLGTTQMQQLDPFLYATNSSLPIISKFLSDPTYRKIYVAHMKTIIEENFSNDWYQTRALDIQSVIDADVQADQNKFFTYSDFLANINNTVGTGGPGSQPSVGLTQLMDARVNYIISQSEFQATAPVISNVGTSSLAVQPFTSAVFNAEVASANQVMLAYRDNEVNRFEKVEMFDDGNNGDGAAGDGVYGVSITAGASPVQYYIYAENNDAAALSPARAEYEFYLLPVATGDLVINEFMADNDSTAMDQDGEFDDWVELYNNSGSEISLAGLYLSDDETELTKWAFPDTSIAANGYLIVWTDNDSGQVGLHANFALSRSGEAVCLTDSDGITSLDQVVFGTQTTDVSTGRFPNGTGDFAEMPPSFAAENTNGITGIEDVVNNTIPQQYGLEQNYPNPFNPSTTFRFTLAQASRVSLTVYNLVGQKIQTVFADNLAAGEHQYVWRGEGQASGVYLYTLQTEFGSESKKMVLMK
ncbi:MAG: CotH kinase family protein [Calditrichia bacterium]